MVGRILGHRQRQSLCFQCGIGIHPSFQPNLLHMESTTAMAERIHRPILLLPAWNDVDMKPGTAVVNAITNKLQSLKKKDSEDSDTPLNEFELKSDEEPPTVSIEFPTMIHGWVSRGNPKDPNVAAEQERALQLTVDFIQKHSV